MDLELNIIVEEYDEQKGQETLNNDKYDWSNKSTDGIGEDKESDK